MSAVLVSLALSVLAGQGPREMVLLDGGTLGAIDLIGDTRSLEFGVVCRGKSAAVLSRGSVGEGDFKVSAVLELGAPRSTMTAFLIGDSRLLLDGRDARMAVEGPLFGGGPFPLGRAKGLWAPAERTDFEATRSAGLLVVRIDGTVVFARRIGDEPVGQLGFSCGRSVLKVHRMVLTASLGRVLDPTYVEVEALQPRIDDSIRRGVDFLLGNQWRDGTWDHRISQFPSGQTAFTAYTLLKVGLAADHPAVRRAFLYLDQRWPEHTYELGVELMARGALQNPGQKDRMRELVGLLVAHQDGTWGYPGTHASPGDKTWKDMSNTLYAALGFLAAQRAGVDVPRRAYESLVRAVLAWQGPEELLDAPTGDRTDRPIAAGFGYKRGGTATGSMTTAGVAVLDICRTGLGESIGPRMDRDIQAAMDKGMRWLGTHYDITGNPGHSANNWRFHYLFGLERVGSLLDTERIGEHPWFLDGAKHLLSAQKDKGYWYFNEDQSDTCLSLLFYKRATAAKTGKGVGSGLALGAASVVATDDNSGEVHIRARGGDPMVVWLEGFDADFLDEYGDDVRVVKVEWVVDDAVAASVTGDPHRAWSPGDRFTARIPVSENGPYEIEARVLIREVSAEDSEYFSQPITVLVDTVLEDWMEDAATRLSRNLLRGRSVTATATSQRGDDSPAAKAVDGLEWTRWAWAKDDQAPVLTLTLDRTVRCNRLVLGSPGGRGQDSGIWDRIRKVEVRWNGAKKVGTVIEMEPGHMRPTVFDLGATKKVRRIELRILEWDKVGSGGGAGFSEVSLEFVR